MASSCEGRHPAVPRTLLRGQCDGSLDRAAQPESLNLNRAAVFHGPASHIKLPASRRPECAGGRQDIGAMAKTEKHRTSLPAQRDLETHHIPLHPGPMPPYSPARHSLPLFAKVRRKTCFSRTGSRAGSSSSPTFSSRKGFPKVMAFSRLERKSRSLSLATSSLFTFS